MKPLPNLSTGGEVDVTPPTEYLPAVALSRDELVEKNAQSILDSKLPGHKTPNAKDLRKTFRFWYEDIIDWMLMNPGKSMAACARALDRDPGTLNVIVRSDVFKARYAQRRAIYTEQMGHSVMDKTNQVALAALEELHEKITTNPAAIPIGLLSEVSDKMLERLGYGVKPVGVTASPVNVHLAVKQEVLQEARDSMRRVQELHREASDEKVVETPALPVPGE